MPVAVGVVVAVIFLVVFSGWFYNLASGWKEYVLDDIFFRYRLLAASIVSLVMITATFFGMGYAFECPNEERQGIFASLSCADYRNIRASAESLFKGDTVRQDEPAQLPSEDQGEFIFDR